jgi:hypothetical protein
VRSTRSGLLTPQPKGSKADLICLGDLQTVFVDATFAGHLLHSKCGHSDAYVHGKFVPITDSMTARLGPPLVGLGREGWTKLYESCTASPGMHCKCIGWSARTWEPPSRGRIFCQRWRCHHRLLRSKGSFSIRSFWEAFWLLEKGGIRCRSAGPTSHRPRKAHRSTA